MWDYDMAKAIKSKPSNDIDQVWYKATYSNGYWLLMGGKLRFTGGEVKYCYSARSAKLHPENGMQTWVLLDKKQNRILILDVVG